MNRPPIPADPLADLIYRYYHRQLVGVLGDLRLFNDGYALFERLGGRYAHLMEEDVPALLSSGPVAFVARQLFGGADYQRLVNLIRSLERVKTAIDAILAELAPVAGQLTEADLIQRYEQAMTRRIPHPEALRIVDDVVHGLIVVNHWFHPTNLLARGRRALIERLIDRVLADEPPDTLWIKDRLLADIRRDPHALPELARRFAAVERDYLADLYGRHAAPN